MELTDKQKQFAKVIAATLDDLKSLVLHEKLILQYSETYLNETLEYVMALPREKIKNSRAAFYVWLVNNNGAPKKKYSGN